MDEGNTALPEFIGGSEYAHDLERVQIGIRGAFEVFSRMSEAHPNIEVRLVRRGCIHQQIALNDSTAILIPYLFSRDTFQSPLLTFGRDCALYAAFTAEFNALWAANAP